MLKKAVIISIILLFFLYPVFSNEDADQLFHQGKYAEAFGILDTEIKNSPENYELLWKFGKTTHALIKRMDNDNDIIDTSSPVIDLLEKAGSVNGIEDSTMARIIYWKTALIAARAKAIGIRKSLKIVPLIFENADKVIALEKDFLGPYFLKVKVDNGVPSFLGGDKFRMMENAIEVLKRNPESTSYYLELAEAIIERDWSINKKEKMTEKYGRSDGSPVNLDDKAFGKQILERAIMEYKKKDSPSFSDTEAYNKALDLLK